ncbi:MAG: hypothetical protein KY455_08740 [Euryarchaeota archaeon]|nr:hypothetical protein [Euryarchaeota archaeon]
MALPTTAEAGRLHETSELARRKRKHEYAALLTTGIAITVLLANLVINPTQPQGLWLKVGWFITTMGLFVMLPLLVFEALRQVRKESLERIEALETRIQELNEADERATGRVQ